MFKKADAGAFTPAPNPMDPKVSGVFENKNEEGSTQEKWGAQLQVALLPRKSCFQPQANSLKL